MYGGGIMQRAPWIWLLSLALLLCNSSLAAPQLKDPQLKAAVSAAMKRVRDRRSTGEERLDALEELNELGPLGARASALFLERDLAKRRKDVLKAEGSLLKDFEARTRSLLKGRFSKEVLAQIEADRAIILQLARGPNLTKDAVHNQSDPALARLEAQLVVSINQVWDVDEPLFEEFVEVLDLMVAERDLYGRFVTSLEVLEEAGEASLLKRIKHPANPEGFEPALLVSLQYLARHATPMTSKDRQVLAANALIDEGVLPEERLGCLKLDWIRIYLGLNALRIDPKLCAAGRDHSKDMRDLKFFAHESPVEGKKSPWMRAANFGTSAHGENIAAGAGNGESAIRMWWYSPGHHKNMLGGHARQGLGQTGSHWTQLFGG